MDQFVRQHLIFYGEVQQVGFRYEMATLAHQAGITGWVRNNQDGSVEAEVQGRLSSIEDLLKALAQTPPIVITQIMRSSRTVIKDERSFKTVYY